MTDKDLIAAFLAKRGATQCGEGAAYGVDKDADKAKRQEARERSRAELDEAAHDRRREAAHDAFFTGDREGGYALMTGYERTAPGVYRRVRFESH